MSENEYAYTITLYSEYNSFSIKYLVTKVVSTWHCFIPSITLRQHKEKHTHVYMVNGDFSWCSACVQT